MKLLDLNFLKAKMYSTLLFSAASCLDRKIRHCVDNMQMCGYVWRLIQWPVVANLQHLRYVSEMCYLTYTFVCSADTLMAMCSKIRLMQTRQQMVSNFNWCLFFFAEGLQGIFVECLV